VGRVLVRVGIWVVVVAVVGAGAVVVVRRVRGNKTTAAPQYFTTPASIGSVTVNVSGSGTVAPVQTASVTGQVAGQVRKVNVSLGQTVKAGQVLYTLNDTTGLSAQLAMAKAQLASAQASLATLEDPQANISQNTITTDQLHVQQAQATLQQDETALSEAKQAEATDGTVTASQAGTITAVDVTAGQSVSAGTPIATLLPTSNNQVTVDVPEEDLVYLPVGALATVVVPLQANVQASVIGRAVLPSGTVTVNSLGEVVSSGSGASTGGSTGGKGGGASQTETESTYALTLQLQQSPGNIPAGEAVQVNLEAVGNPPSTFPWSYTGSMVVPKTVTLTAQAAGTMTSVPTVDEQVTNGQPVASLSDPTASQTVANDTLKVEEDQASLQADQTTLSDAQNPTPPTASSILTAEAQISNDQVTVLKDEQNIADLTVTAPISGLVTAVDVQPGQNVGASTVGVTLDSSALQVSTSVDELNIGQIKTGQAVQVSVSAFPGTTYPGTVSAISPVASSSGGVSTYPVTIVLTNTQNLRPGMSATATIQVASASHTLRVPAQAVTVAGSAGTGILQVMQNGTPHTTTVKVGLVGTSYDQILSGLQVGQLVVAGRAVSTTTTSTRGGAGARAFGGGGLGGGFAGGFPGGGGGGFVARGG
jgi:RND family efflux transporter MFP subunit